MNWLKIIFGIAAIVGLFLFPHIVLGIISVLVVLIFAIALIQFAIKVNRDCRRD